MSEGKLQQFWIVLDEMFEGVVKLNEDEAVHALKALIRGARSYSVDAATVARFIKAQSRFSDAVREAMAMDDPA